MPSRSVNALPKSKIVRSLDTLEGDLISGIRNSHIATLVERKSRFVLLAVSTAKTLQVSSPH